MTANTYKYVEIIGSSTQGSDDAVSNAIAKASKTLDHLEWFEVLETRGHIVNGLVAHWQATIKIGFRLDD
jgi:dodecin